MKITIAVFAICIALIVFFIPISIATDVQKTFFMGLLASFILLFGINGNYKLIKLVGIILSILLVINSIYYIWILNGFLLFILFLVFMFIICGINELLTKYIIK